MDELERANAQLNLGLEAIEPLIEHHTRVMGHMNGRLQIALDYLTDVETTAGWNEQPAGVRSSIECSRLLVSAVLRLANAAQSAQNQKNLGRFDEINPN